MRGSGYLQVLCKVLCYRSLKSTPQGLLLHCQQKSSLYNCLFCFQVGIFHQRPSLYLNLQHFHSLLLSATPTMNFCICDKKREVVRLYTTSGLIAIIGLHPLSHHVWFLSDPPQGDIPFLLKWFIHQNFHTSKISTKFSISPKLIISQASGLNLGWPLSNLLFPAHYLFSLVISPILAFLSFLPWLEKSISTIL